MSRDPRLGVVFFAKPVVSVIWDEDSRFFWVDCGEGEVLGVVRLGRRRAHNLLTAGFPREHLVIAWKSVDLPTFARPT
jgi:hypothetical protein